MRKMDVPQQMEELCWVVASDQIDVLIPLNEEVGELCECREKWLGEALLVLLGEVVEPGLELEDIRVGRW